MIKKILHFFLITLLFFTYLVTNAQFRSVYYQPVGAFDVSSTSFSQFFSIAAQDNAPTGVTFNSNGTKMYVIGTQSDQVREYNLGTAYNVSTAVYFQGFSVAAQDGTPTGVTFNKTGTKMYIIGSGNDQVREYNLGTPFNVSTAVYLQGFSVAAQDGTPQGVAFNNDGTRMFVVGSGNDRVYQYNLATGFNVSTAVYNSFIAVNTQDNAPTDVVFNTTGTKMYVIGTQRDRINEYNLGTAFSVSTAVFSQFYAMGTQDGTPQGIVFNASGTKVYMIGQANDRVYEYLVLPTANLNYIETGANNGAVSGSLSVVLVGDTFKNPIINTTDVVITGVPAGLTPSYALSLGNTVLTITLTGSAASHANANDVANLTFTFNNSAFTGGSAATVGNATGPASSGMGIDFRDPDVRTVYYQPNGAFNVSTTTFSQFLSIAAQDNAPTGVTFNNNGTKMYVIGTQNDRVREYNLGTAYDVSSAVYFQQISVAAQDGTPQGIVFNNSGTKMYIVGSANDRVYEYNLGTAYNVSTAVYSQNLSVVAQDTNPTGINFNSNGTKMYVVGSTNDRVYEYNLSAPYNISTAVYSTFISVVAQDNVPTEVIFNTTGTKMYVIGTQRDRINEYNLGTAFSISTAVFSQFYAMGTQDGTPQGIAFNASGTKVYMIGQANDRVYEYLVLPTANLNYIETGANNGAVSGSLSVVLVGDTFKNPIINTTDVVITGVPAGLTPSYALSLGNTVLTITLTGSAASHANANDVANLTFTFNNSAFTGGSAATVGNATGPASSGMGIDFRDPDVRTVYYQPNGAFNVSTTTFSQFLSIAAQDNAPTGVTFNNNGTKMYVIGTQNDQVREYNLGTAYNVSTAVYFQGFSVAAQDATPQGVVFNNSGTKMYVVGSTNDRVYEYNLGTAYNVSTAVYSQNLSVVAQDTNPTGINFNSNGTKMYVVGTTNDRVYEYNLSAPYNISTAVYSTFISVVAQDNVPTEVIFNTTGTKMYVIGTQNDRINEYNLGTAFSISTAVFSQFYAMGTQDGTPQGIAFNASGTKVYMIGQANDRVNEYNMVSVSDANYKETIVNDGAVSGSLSVVLVGDTFKNPMINTTDVVITGVSAGLTPSYALSLGNTVLTITLTGKATAHENINDVANLTFAFNNSAFTGGSAATVNNATGPANSGMGIDFRDTPLGVLVYVPNGGYDISTTTYNQNFLVSAQDNTPNGITFNNSGTKMYMIGSGSDQVREYNLGTAYNVSTASYLQGFSVAGQDGAPQGVTFNYAGTKMFVVGSTNDRVYEYTLSTPYNVSTATYIQFFSVAAQDTNPTGVAFSYGGYKMFVVGTTNDRVYEYTLTTAFNLSTASFTRFYSVAGQETTPSDVTFNPNGTKMYIVGSSSDNIVEYNLTTAYDLSAVSYSQSFSINTQEGTSTGLAFHPNGTKVFVVGSANDRVQEYIIVTPLNQKFTESASNNGSVTGSLNIYLTTGSFQDTDNDNILDVGSEVSLPNVPAGLTSAMTLSQTDTVVTLTFAGTATDHENANDVNSLLFNFDNTAFSGPSAASIENATGPYSSGISVDFDDTVLAPGGVFNNLTYWIKADENIYSDAAGTVPVNNGDIVEVWNNKQNLGFNLTQNNGASDPNYIASDVNFNPAVEFDGNDALRNASTEAIDNLIDRTTDNNSFFSVHNISAGVVVAGYEGTDTNSRAGYFALSGSAQQVAYGHTTLNQTGTANIASRYVIAQHGITATSGQLYINGATDGGALALNNYAGGSANGYLSFGARPTLASFSTSKIAEYFIYDKALTITERQRINTYLAIKYGITLPHNYLASNGSTVYNVSTFGNDIAGLANEELVSTLHQKQSKTINTNDCVIISTEAIALSNTENTTDIPVGHYLVWGTNGGDFSSSGVSNTFNLGSVSTSLTSINRKWKITETGADVPDVLLSFPATTLETGYPKLSSETYYLLVYDNSTFLNADLVDAIPLTLNGSYYQANYDFVGTQYFTIAVADLTVDNSAFSASGSNYALGSSSLNLDNTFTINFWVKNNSTGGVVLAKGLDYQININGTDRIEMAWNGATRITSTTALPDGIWSHVSITFGAGTAKLYIDGVLDTTENSLPLPTATTSHFSLGALYTSKVSITNYFNGSIDELSIWDIELSQTELRYIMNQKIEEHTGGTVTGKIIPQDITKNDIALSLWSDLKAYYDFDNFSASLIKDLSNNNFDLNINYLADDKTAIESETAPLPYQTNGAGLLTATATWLNGAQQKIPGSNSIVDSGIKIDWNIVETNHNLEINQTTTLLALHNQTNTISVTDDRGLTVTHYLKIDDKIDLQGESQLIQTTNSELDETSAGVIEKDQQGTANTYTFNYWGSPVGLQNNTANNVSYTLSDVLNDGTDPDNPAPINFITGLNGVVDTPISITTRWLYKYNNRPQGQRSEWQKIDNTTTILVGEGFTMKGPDASALLSAEQNYVFVGKPNNGDIVLPISDGNNYLVGNPYPSALDAHEFLKDNNTVLNGTLYFWEHWGGGNHLASDYQGGYAVYNYAGGLPAADIRQAAVLHPDLDTSGTGTKIPGRYIPASQGFFVEAINDGNITFENDQRVFALEDLNSVFFKSSSKKNQTNDDSRTKLNLGFQKENGIHRKLLLTVDESTTLDFDWGYDAPLLEEQSDDMSWMIDDKNYVIQSIPKIETTTGLPLKVVINQSGKFSIALEEKLNLQDSQKVYLLDKEFKSYTDLTITNFETVLGKGQYNNRFEIVFRIDENLSNSDFNTSLQIIITQNMVTKELELLNQSNQVINQVILYNLMGQKILEFNKQNIQQNQTKSFYLNNIASGLYLVKTDSEINPQTSKVMIKN